MNRPTPTSPVVLGTPHFLIIKNGTSSFTTAIGAGPYRCRGVPARHQVDRRAQHRVLQAEASPISTEIELFGIPDQTARLNALLSSDVQIAAAISPQLAQRVRASTGHAVFETKAGGYNDLVIRQKSDQYDTRTWCWR